MKTKLIPFVALLLFSVAATAQDVRFFDKIFQDVKKDSNIVYGSNYTYNFMNVSIGLIEEDQTIDIYQPVGDTAALRPLIIWAHGGSFMGGTKDDADIVHFCNEFAQRGFVTASINYRLGFELPIDSVEAVRTVYRALQDGRAAVRYMRSIADSLNIDTSKIYFGGTSAGAFIALNMVYLNLNEEVPSYLDTNERLSINAIRGFGLDNIEGLTNTIDESSDIDGIINFCGATKTLDWLADDYAINTPIISMHGTEDGTVPYATRVINVNDITPIPPQVPLPIVKVLGSYDIDKYLDNTSATSKFYTWYGADHVPYINFHSDSISNLYMDTLMSFTVKHVFEDFLGLGTVTGLGENEPPCDYNNGLVLPCAAYNGVDDLVKNESTAYPNPFNTVLNFNFNSDNSSILIFNALGRIVYSNNNVGNTLALETKEWKTGVYFVKIKNRIGTQEFKLIKN